MSFTQQKVIIGDLVIGMFVSSLDRPWVETPFPLQGFRVNGQDDISTLEKYCKFVYVDARRSTIEVEAAGQPVSKQLRPSRRRVVLRSGKTIKPVLHTKIQCKSGLYSVKTSVKKELKSATGFKAEIETIVHDAQEMFRRDGAVNMAAMQRASRSIVSSILRNPDALVWLGRVKDSSKYSYQHSIRMATTAVIVGRSLGLPNANLENLALGCLLSEVGMSKIPPELLQKPGKLTEDEFQLIKEHVNYGVEMISTMTGMNSEVLSIVQLHHERHDGSGYPFGFMKSEIPLLPQIAGICDTFDALTSERPYAKQKSSQEATAVLFNERGKLFHKQLVETLIQALGIYPTGSLVQLDSEEVAVVVEQNEERRLMPKVMILMDGKQQRLKRPKTIDIAKIQNSRWRKSVRIARGLGQGAYGLNPEELIIRL